MEAPKTAIVMGPPEVSCENSVCSPRVLPRNVIPRSSVGGGRVRAEDSMAGGFETKNNVCVVCTVFDGFKLKHEVLIDVWETSRRRLELATGSASISGARAMVWLFPNWVVKWVRYAKPHTAGWLQQPVEVFHVSPKMTKLEIKEYLRKLYNLPVIKVHTANYLGKKKVSRTGKQYKVRGGPHSRRSMPAPLTS
ncbi:MAG: hypothetical protein SGPRY_014351 [Prymnesium sp.]